MTEVVNLEFTDGTKLGCEILGVFDAEGRSYAALIPVEASNDIYVYGYDEGEDNFNLYEIEGEAEFNSVISALSNLLAEALA